MRTVVILALDPGQTTGWALVRKRDKEVLGLGDLAVSDVGCGIDLLVRSMNVSGYTVEAVVEQMPTIAGVGGDLAADLEFVRRTIDHYLEDIFEVPTDYVLPGTWKTSRIARTTTPPPMWNGVALSQHMKDAVTMAWYQAGRRAS